MTSAKRFAELGFKLVATRGTAAALRNAGLQCKTVLKVNEGRPNAVDLLKGGNIQLAIYTTDGRTRISSMRRPSAAAPSCTVSPASRR